ncbi:MAG TPA: hypothetical protein ENI16_00990 [Candidatus Portnoybacteria bacterium]|nr:hypothetical protein [Candidatus Portnoybacteria bacterium]
MIFVLGIWMMTVKDYSRKARETSSSVERTIENLKENLPPLRADIKEGVSDLLVPEEKKSSPIKLPLGTND